MAFDALPARWLESANRLLEAVDLEFVPPLSARSSTRQTDFESAAGRNVSQYLNEMADQSCILGLEGEALSGLLSYCPDAVVGAIGLTPPSAYVSTVCVQPARRRRGIAEALYGALEANLPRPVAVATRTWSTNTSHIGLLLRRGFKLALELPNDRQPGVSTVYFRLDLEGSAQ
ncbi:MAG: GNAT family N-acetyltransferase [Bifidobacteriaceae bacterium]|nr:GNAT family N-acetyltransferase [Bifidobacteriaceae bacterium]